jgi:4-amino-4-deoxy-L-arabinose transferase-like glycosyltransferase
MKKQLLHQTLIIAAAGVVFFTTLGAAGLWDNDEPVYATCAREMLQRNDWVVPYFNGTLFPDKPPLMFWTMIAGYKIFGINELGARCGSAVMALLTALATYHLGRRLFAAEVGLWAGLILPATFIFTVSARAATVDSTLTLATLLAILCFALGGIAEGKGDRHLLPRPTFGRCPPFECFAQRVPVTFSPSWICWVGVYACLGVAVLAKGPIGLLLPAAGIGLFLMVMNHLHRPPTKARSGKLGRWVDGLVWCARLASPGNFLRSLWQMRPLTGIAVTTAIALPWFVLVGQRTHGVWIEQFLAEFNLRPFTRPILGHGGPFWYYVPAILIGFFPWSVFMGPTLIDWTQRIRRAHPWRTGYLLLACWTAVFFLFWSICKTKLPSYLLPIWPALALATAAFVHHWLAEPAILGRKSVWIAWGIAIAVGTVCLGVFPIVAHRYAPGEELLGMIGLILVAGGGLSLWLVRRGRRQAGLAVFAAMSLVLITACFGYAALRIDRHQNARPLMARIHADCPGEPSLVFYGFMQKSCVYYAGRPVECCEHADDLRRLLGTSRSYVLSDDAHAAHLMRRYPGEFRVLDRRPQFLRSGEVVVLVHPGSSSQGSGRLSATPSPSGRGSG